MLDIRKVRGENKVAPFRITATQMAFFEKIAKKRGVTTQDAINNLIANVAKKKRWKWYFERKVNKSS